MKESSSLSKLVIRFFLIIFYLIGGKLYVWSCEHTSDTLIIKAGDCKLLDLGNDRIDALMWNTGNQDIAVPEAVFGSVRICGINEGLTYISGSSLNGYRQIHMMVKVIPDTTNKIVTNTVIFQPSIDKNAEGILKRIMAGNPETGFKSKLKVSNNKRYLIEEKTGRPFLFLSQTLWSMTRRLSREEIIKVLDICVEQGFTVIQLLAHSHYMGPNAYNDLPFKNDNFLCPSITTGNNPYLPEEYDWWDHLEFIIQECIKREMYVCLLPTWREQWNQKKNLHKNNAYAYGKFIGQRYQPYNSWIIWVMGGDEAPNTQEKMAIHRELARGVATGISGKEDYSQVIMSYHTHGPTSTTDFFYEDEPFMDFNTIQSGHDLNNLEGMMEKTYIAQEKPVMDFEPFYTKNGQTTNETRTIIYWGVFSGGFGASYGSWNLWHCGARNDLAQFSIPDAFYEGFGTQINHLGKLLTSYPILLREPNQKLLIDNRTIGLDRILACTATDKSYAMVYSPKGEPFIVDLSFIDCEKIYWYWFNPRNGEIFIKGSFRKNNSTHQFSPPSKGERFSGNDWILLLHNDNINQK
jgi:hypothetical protein